MIYAIAAYDCLILLKNIDQILQLCSLISVLSKLNWFSCRIQTFLLLRWSPLNLPHSPRHFFLGETKTWFFSLCTSVVALTIILLCTWKPHPAEWVHLGVVLHTLYIPAEILSRWTRSAVTCVWTRSSEDPSPSSAEPKTSDESLQASGWISVEAADRSMEDGASVGQASPASAEGPSGFMEYLSLYFFYWHKSCNISLRIKTYPTLPLSCSIFVWRMCFATNVKMAPTTMKARTWTHRCLADSGWDQRHMGGPQWTNLLIKRLFEFWSLED